VLETLKDRRLPDARVAEEDHFERPKRAVRRVGCRDRGKNFSGSMRSLLFDGPDKDDT
jgi:hypothetical protein